MFFTSVRVMEELDDVAIDAQVEKELDAISLSSLDLTLSEACEENQESDLYDTAEHISASFGDSDDCATLLYLEKSSERRKVAQDILDEAEEVLSRCNTARTRPEQDTYELEDHDFSTNEFIPYELTLLKTELEGKELACAKSAEEIEEENQMRLSELEERLNADAERKDALFERDKMADQEEMKVWIEKEEKMQKSMKTMLEKAEYWEKTYDQVAQDELAQRESEIQEEFLKSQKQIAEMEQEQKKILHDLMKEKEELDRNRKENAAKCIQTQFRGYSARRKYGDEVREKIFQMKERIRQKRIEAIERKRAEEKKAKEESEKKAKEEREKEKKMQDMEAKKKKVTSSDAKVENVGGQYASGCKDSNMSSPSVESAFAGTPDTQFESNTESASIGRNSSPVVYGFASVRHSADISPEEVDSENRTANVTVSEGNLRAGNENVCQAKMAVSSTGKKALDEVPQSIQKSLSTLKLLKQSAVAAGITEGGKISQDKLVVIPQDSGIISQPDGSTEHSPSMQKTLSTDRCTAKTSGEFVVNDCKEGALTRVEQKAESNIVEPNDSSTSGSFASTSKLRTLEDIEIECLRTKAENDKSFSKEEFESLLESPCDANNATPPTSFNKPVCLEGVSPENLTKMDNFPSSTQKEKLEKPSETSHNTDEDACRPSFKNLANLEDAALENPIKGDNLSSSSQNQDGETPKSPSLSSHTVGRLLMQEDSFKKTIGASDAVVSQVEKVVPKSELDQSIVNVSDDSLKFHGKVGGVCQASQKNCSNESDFEKNSKENGKEFDCEKDVLIKHCSVDMPPENKSEKLPKTTESTLQRQNSDKINPTECLTRAKNVEECVTQPEINTGNNRLENIPTSHDEPARSDSRSKTNKKEGIIDSSPGQGSSLSQLSENSEIICVTEIPSTESAGKHFVNELYESEKITGNLDTIEKQRQGWLGRWKTKSLEQNIERKFPSTHKRRRMVRISSAAKRLVPFSEEELLNAAYLTPECRVGNRPSSVEESRCIVLSHIQDGRNLSTLANCAHLTYLTVQNCGLVSLENLQSCPCLKYIDAAHNVINMLSCGGMRSLEYLDLSHNRLTSIHGLEGCQSLIFIDLSSNNIAKVTALEDVRNLSHLRLANNQLVNISALRCCENLVYLDVSENHLMRLEDLEFCKMLMVVTASGNNLESLSGSFLDNSILLTKLVVNRNNLTSLGLSKGSWLPLLTEVRADVNRIGSNDDSVSNAPDFSIVAPFLCAVDLSKNLISTLDGLKSLSACQCLQKADLTENPLPQPGDKASSFLCFVPEIVTEKTAPSQSIGTFSEFFRKFCPLDQFGKRFADLTEQKARSDSIVTVVSKQLNELQAEVKRHSTEIQRAAVRWDGRQCEYDGIRSTKFCPPQMFSIHANHLKKLLEMAARFRKWHENSVHILTPEANGSTLVNSDKSMESVLTEVGQEEDMVSSAAQLDAEIQAENQSTQHLSVDSASIFKKAQSQAKTESALQLTNFSVTHSSAVYEKLNLRKEVSALENVAVKKIQAYWRGCRVRRHLSCVANTRLSAATRIQAIWRGYRTRRKINKAMEMLKMDRMETPRHEEFVDVDLEGFEFDEKLFDQQWAYKVSDFDTMYSEFQFEDHTNHMDVRKAITDTKTISLPCSKPPLPPITSQMETDIGLKADLTDLPSEDNSVMDSNRTKSTKQEILTNQWGIKSSSTADLMMRRARRMKGGKKKMQSAGEKLLRFQEKVSNFQTPEWHSTTKRKHPTNKVEYFKAREQEHSQKNKIPSDEDEQKMKYTYEWLHSQVGSNYNPHHKTSPPRKPHPSETQRTRSSGFLPAIPRSPSLVGVQDLEVVSVASSGTNLDRSKERLRDIARRHNPYADARS